MKNENLIILAAAAAGVFVVYKMTRAKASPQGNTASSLNNGGALPTMEITNTALPGQTGWGWKYYTDGTSIGPDGTYYQGGSTVYKGA